MDEENNSYFFLIKSTFFQNGYDSQVSLPLRILLFPIHTIPLVHGHLRSLQRGQQRIDNRQKQQQDVVEAIEATAGGDDDNTNPPLRVLR